MGLPPGSGGGWLGVGAGGIVPVLGELGVGELVPRLGAVRVIAIDGPSGSGKSMLADRVVAGLRGAGVPVGLVRTDDFATWEEPVSWWPRLVAGVLEPLAEGRVGGYQRMEWVDGRPRPGAWVTVAVPDVLVLEGVSAGRRSVRPRLSALVWCEFPDPGRRLERAVARDGEGCRAPLREWQGFEAGWFAVDDPAMGADVRYSDTRGTPE